jgi:hypothetical protein
VEAYAFNLQLKLESDVLIAAKLVLTPANGWVLENQSGKMELIANGVMVS